LEVYTEDELVGRAEGEYREIKNRCCLRVLYEEMLRWEIPLESCISFKSIDTWENR
jgi:hypothetical protein